MYAEMRYIVCYLTPRKTKSLGYSMKEFHHSKDLLKNQVYWKLGFVGFWANHANRKVFLNWTYM